MKTAVTMVNVEKSVRTGEPLQYVLHRALHGRFLDARLCSGNFNIHTGRRETGSILGRDRFAVGCWKQRLAAALIHADVFWDLERRLLRPPGAT
jgi:hypothetical protein